MRAWIAGLVMMIGVVGCASRPAAKAAVNTPAIGSVDCKDQSKQVDVHLTNRTIISDCFTVVDAMDKLFAHAEPPPATHHPSLPTPKGDKAKRKKPHSKVRFGGDPDDAYWCDMKECMFPNMIQQQPPTASICIDCDCDKPERYNAQECKDLRQSIEEYRKDCVGFLGGKWIDKKCVTPAASDEDNKCIGFNGKENVILPCSLTYSPTASNESTFNENGQFNIVTLNGCGNDYFVPSADGKTCEFTVVFTKHGFMGITCTALTVIENGDQKLVCSYLRDAIPTYPPSWKMPKGDQ